MQPVEIHRCLSDETRLRMLHLLAQGPLCVCHLQSIISLDGRVLWVNRTAGKNTKDERTNMSRPKNEEKHPNNMEKLKQQASACGSGCGCHTAVSSGKTRWIIGVVVLAVAGVMVARAITKSGGT